MVFPHEPKDPVARLWQEVEPWFRRQLDDEDIQLRDELGIVPAHGVTWTDLPPAELDRAWAVIADRIDPPSPILRWPDAMKAPLLGVLSEGAFAAASRRYLPMSFDVEAVMVANERLPTLTVTIDADTRRPGASRIGVSWRVNDPGWTPRTVATLAVLIGDLRNLLPTAQMSFDRQPEIIWHAIDTYLASRGSEPDPPAPHN